MPRCSICHRSNLQAIEASLVEGKVVPDVAATFGLNENSLRRHVSKCPRSAATPAATLHSVAPRNTTSRSVPESSPDTVRSERVLKSARANIRQIAKTIDGLLEEAQSAEGATYAEKASLARTALAANRQLAQLTGEIGVSEASVLASPSVQRLLANIVEALKPFPDASKAVIAVLEHRSVAA